MISSQPLVKTFVSPEITQYIYLARYLFTRLITLTLLIFNGNSSSGCSYLLYKDVEDSSGIAFTKWMYKRNFEFLLKTSFYELDVPKQTRNLLILSSIFQVCFGSSICKTART